MPVNGAILQQKNFTGVASGGTVVLDNPVTAGSILAIILGYSAVVGTPSAADNRSNTWSNKLVTTVPNGAHNSALAAVNVAAGATTITLTLATATDLEGIVIEIADDGLGVFDTKEDDVGTGAALASGNATAGSYQPNQAALILEGHCSTAGNPAASDGTFNGNLMNGGNFNIRFSQRVALSPSGTYAAAGTTTSSDWTSLIMLFKITAPAAVDVSVDAVVSSSTARAGRSVVFPTAYIGYVFLIDADNNFKYIKTTDGGLTWGSLTTIKSGDTTVAFDVWFDQWTSGENGTLIHTAHFGSVADDVFYRTLDTNGDSLGTERTIFAGASAVAGRGAFCSIAKMRSNGSSNYLFCAFDIDAGAERGFYRSTDAGVNWASRDATLVEATGDECLLFPGNEADPNDCWALYHDASANALTLKMHDDSAGTTSESASIATVTEETTDGTGQRAFAGAVRHSDGHLFCAVWTEYDSATGDFRFFDINGTGSILEKTALATDKDDSYYPSVYIHQPTGAIHVAYIGKLDGTETIGTTTTAYFAVSLDGGGTWSSNKPFSVNAMAWRQMWTPPTGPRFAGVWRESVTNQLVSNYGYSSSFPPMAPGLMTKQAIVRAAHW